MIVKPTAGYNPYPLFAGGTCEGCPLFRHKSHPNPNDINAFSLPEIGVKGGVLVLGEALGDSEAKSGTPFKGRAGAELNRVLYRLKQDRKDVSIWNVVGCKPPINKLSGEPYEEDATAHCDFYFRRVIKEVRPKVIVAVGATAMKKVLGREYCEVKEPVKRLRGYVYQRALTIDGELYRFYVVPTYHPAFIMRGQQYLHWVVLQDFHKAFTIDNYSAYDPTYIEDPSPSQVSDFITQCKQHKGVIAVDIETPRSGMEPDEELYRHFDDINITDISFSISPTTAITMKLDRYAEAIRVILGMPFEYSVWWNGLDFDIPRLKGKGFHIKSEPLDAMWLWHYVQPDIPKALGYVASLLTDMPEWKTQHNSRPEWYSCCDADATITCFNAMRDMLRRESRWDSYLRDGHRILPLLDEIGLKGIPFDAKQHNRFKDIVEERLDKVNRELQMVVPVLCKPFTIKKTLMIPSPCRKCFGEGYRVDGRRLKLFDLKVKDLLPEHKTLDIYDKGKMCPVCKGSGIKDYRYSAYNVPDGTTYGDYEVRKVSTEVAFWLKEKPFLYNGDTQVMNYIRWRGHSAKSTDEDELKRLIRLYKDDMVYPLVLECRKLDKLKGQYGKGIRVSPDGTLKTKFTLKPATGRLASEQLIHDKEGCNVQNIPKRANEFIDGQLIKELRNSIVAPKGSVLVGIDYRAIEAVLAGWFAQDENYIAAAKVGIHAIMASIMLAKSGGRFRAINPLDPDAAEKVAKIKQNHKQLYDTNKILVHMSTYLGTPYKLVRQFPEHFPTVAVGQRHQGLFFRTLAKKLRQWQLEVMQLAHRQHYLENPFGYRRYFWDVIGKDGKLGTQAREAVCTLPQGTAGAVIRQAMLSLPPYLLDCLRWQIHDELLFVLPSKCHREWAADIMGIMTRPIPQLGGLVIDVEAEVGEKWGEMEPYQ